MDLKLLDDRQLIQQYQADNQSAFEELLHRHKNRIFTYIYMLVKNQPLAEDLFQEVFIKIINTIRSNRYNDEGKFLPWAMRIAHNIIIDYFRKENRSPLDYTDDEGAVPPPPDFLDDSIEDKLLKQQQVANIRRLIQLLPSEQKEVVLMRHYGEMSFKDIAEATGVSINTALGRMRYAVTNLKRQLLQQEAAYK